MAIFNVRRTGYGTAAETVIKLIEDLTANGMRLVYPNDAFGPIAPTALANIHPDTGFMMTKTRINFDGDPYFPVARFILESTSDIDVKTTLAKTAVSISFTGTVASNADGTSTLSVTVPPSVGAIKKGMTINLPGASVTTTTTTTTTAAPSGTTTTPAPAPAVVPYSGQIQSGSGTTWIVTAMQESASPVTITATDNFTSLSDPTVLTEGWRICFDFPLQFIDDYALTTINATTKVRTGGLTTKVAGSTVFEDFMAVYVGTSVQLRNDGQVSILPDVRTIGNAVKVGFIQPDGLIGSPYRYPGFNSVSTKAVALAPPIAVMKGYITPAPNVFWVTKRLGGMITANMVLSGGETGTIAPYKNLRILPQTFIDMDPQTNSNPTVTGTGLGDTGSYSISTPSGYTGYTSTSAFIPTIQNPIKVVGVSAEINGADVGFINRINLDRLSGLAVPVSYELTITKKGLFIAVWDILSEQTGRRFNWVLVQRSVDRVSGAIRGRSKTTESGTVATFLDSTASSVCPVYCVNGVNNLYYQFTVREADQGGPSIPRSASANSEDNTAIINPFDQQSITDEGKYVITFLNKLNTSRHRYADELDTIGTVSSDVIGFGTEVRISAYGEELGNPGLQRVYRSLPSNNPYGTGMRVMILTGWETIENGIGVPGTPYPAGPMSETPPAASTTTTTTAAPTTTTTTTAAPSDRRLKRNITFLETRNGINIYSFQYLWRDEYFVGVMAQDLLGTEHESAVVESNGRYTVDYSQLGFNMQLLTEYTPTAIQEQQP